MSGPKPTAECEVCNGPVSTFIAYNHENGTQTERILREDWEASVDAHHEYEASLRAEVERLKDLVREALDKERDSRTLYELGLDWRTRAEVALARKVKP